MPKRIKLLYIYFLTKGGKSRDALDEFYNTDSESKEFVRRYAIRGKKFYADFMKIFLDELKDRDPFSGVITPHGRI